MTVNKLDSNVIKYMAEKLEFMGSLSDIIENVVNGKPSRALAAYFLFKVVLFLSDRRIFIFAKFRPKIKPLPPDKNSTAKKHSSQ